MEFSTFTFFKIVFILLSPFILIYAIPFMVGIAIALASSGSSQKSSVNLAPEKQQRPTKQEDKHKEQEKKKKTALQWAVEQQKKENARQRALARQAEQVRIAQAQSEHYKQFGIGH